MAPSVFLEETVFSQPEAAQLRHIQSRYEASTALTEAVKRGNLSLAKHMVAQMTHMQQEFVRSKSALRNAQNLCIVLNTQLRHALEDVGIHPYHLDRVSDGIARKIEELQSLEQLNSFFMVILEHYCALTAFREEPAASTPIRLSAAYIRAHLTDNLTVQETARELSLNPDYLSHRFRQEMGIGFIDFVNRERCALAAALLERTDIQIQQIALAAGYNNMSYFARQFRRWHGISPRTYRRQAAD